MDTNRELIYQYFREIAKANGVSSYSENFNVIPTIHEQMVQTLQERNDFLGRINLINRDEKRGGKIFADLSEKVTGRTKVTSINKRTWKGGVNTRDQLYECVEYEHDLLVTWEQLDEYVRFPEFQQIYRNMMTERIGLDLVQIMWNGTSIAENPAAPDLTDVDKGFIQKAREKNPDSLLSSNRPGSNQIVICDPAKIAGKTAEAWAADKIYKKFDLVLADNGKIFICRKNHTSSLANAPAPTMANPTANWANEPLPEHANLDAFVADWSQLMDDIYLDDCVLFCGRQILAADQTKLFIKHGDDPEKKAEVIQSTKSYGGYLSFKVPRFPADKLCLTQWKNLSHYFQRTSRRRQIVDDPKEKGVIDYNSVNCTPEVENYDAFIIAENIVILQ